MGTFKESQAQIEPVTNAFLIVPNDVNFIEKTRAISLDSTARVDVTMADGQRIVLPLAGGILHPIAIVKLWTTGTTATGVYGYY